MTKKKLPITEFEKENMHNPAVMREFMAKLVNAGYPHHEARDIAMDYIKANEPKSFHDSELADES